VSGDGVFTGLIETLGTVREVRPVSGSVRLAIASDMDGFEVPAGGSVSVNGACLTLESRQDALCRFTAVAETLRRTTLAGAQAGERVNLERALAASGRVDGHFVLGHVDGVGTITGWRHEGESVVCTVAVPTELMPFMAEKGSVALDGISLTIAASRAGSIDVALVPHTLVRTTMSVKRPGARVNIECDVLARYLAQLASAGRAGAGQAAEDLQEKMARLGF